MITKERLLIDESRFNGRLLNSKAKPLLLEVEGGLDYLERCKNDPNLPIFLVGIIQSGDKPNRNGRIYMWERLKRECTRYMTEQVFKNKATGELDHPEDSSTPSLRTASHIIVDMWFEGKDVWAKVKLLNAYAGPDDPAMKARSLILNGCNIGISSRALGSLDEQTKDGYDIVGDDLEFVCWDLVSNASNFGSETMTVTQEEKHSTNRRVKMLSESQCKGPHMLGNNKRLDVAKAKVQELTEEEKVYLDILGVEKFLEVSKKFN